MTRRLRAAAVAVVLGAWTLTACGAELNPAPRCNASERVALVAQSVPSASYLPCLAASPAGWTSSNFRAATGETRFVLSSDRSQGHPVDVDFASRCHPGNATPIAPRTPGGRTYLELASIDPRYAGTMYDLFPGGCVTYRFDFSRGEHIALMAEMESAVGFVARSELRRTMRDRFGVELGP